MNKILICHISTGQRVWLIAGGAKRLLSVWLKLLNCSWHAVFQWSKIAARSAFILLYRLCGTINVGVLWEQTGWTLLIWTKGSLKIQLFETNSFWSCLCSAHWVFVWFIFLTGLSSDLHKEPKCERRKGAKDLFVCFCFGVFVLFIWGGKRCEMHLTMWHPNSTWLSLGDAVWEKSSTCREFGGGRPNPSKKWWHLGDIHGTSMWNELVLCP